MAKYAITNTNTAVQQNLTTTYKTQISLTAATGATTLRKAWIYDILFGADGTPADNQITYKVDRQTSVGTVTTVTGANVPDLETTDAAALIVVSIGATIEPIVTAQSQLIEESVNERASYRWVASPGGELVVPATNVAGIGIRAKSSAYTSTVTCGLFFWE